MIYFIGIVFIAELIILYHIVLFLIRTDKKVCLATEHVNKRRMILKWRMRAITEITDGLNEIAPILERKFHKSKRNLIVRIANDALQGIILLFFKPKYKKALLGLKTGVNVTRKLLRL